MKRLVGVKILAADFRRDIALADIGAQRAPASPWCSRRRQHAIEVHSAIEERSDCRRRRRRSTGDRFPRSCASRRGKSPGAPSLSWRPAWCIPPPRPSRRPAAPCRAADRARPRSQARSRRPACRWRSVRVLVEDAVGIEIAVGRPVELGGVGFQRMRGKLFDINLGRGGEALGAQRVEARTALPSASLRSGKPYLAPRLVGRDQRRRVLDRRGRSGEMGNACFVALVHRVPSILHESRYAGILGWCCSCQPLIRSKLTAIDESVGYLAFGKATPTMQSRVTMAASCSCDQPSVPAGRSGSTR